MDLPDVKNKPAPPTEEDQVMSVMGIPYEKGDTVWTTLNHTPMKPLIEGMKPRRNWILAVVERIREDGKIFVKTLDGRTLTRRPDTVVPYEGF